MSRDRYIHSKCQTITVLSTEAAKSWEEHPETYSRAYCVYCRAHYQVGEYGEFVWEDGEKVGT